uniref:dUTPase-like domain-containing protein n=1 Tax=viral metagenome TaxID=1070528 RepID=A0A6C0DP34_9ZZZZ
MLNNISPLISKKIANGDITHYALLNIAIPNDNHQLTLEYIDHISKHNTEMLNNAFPNSGFDLIMPSDVVFNTPFATTMVNLQVKAEMIYYDHSSKQSVAEYSPYLIHPRSSISKTPLMLANHTGIIDSGYRGLLMAAFRWLKYSDDSEYTVNKYTRLLQICHPSLCRIFVNIVEESDLTSSERGAGGFGSTGR